MDVTLTLAQYTDAARRAAIAAEMTRILADPDSDRLSLAEVKRRAIANLTHPALLDRLPKE